MARRVTRREAVQLAFGAGAGLFAGCGSSDTRAPKPEPAPPRHTYGTAASQFGELSIPNGEGPFPVAVAVHGGFWSSSFDLTHLRKFCAALAESGWAAWSVEYRRVGDDGGWPNTFLDVAAATDHLRALAPEHKLDLKRVVSIGHSAGGHLALWLTARHKLAPGSALHRPDPLPLRGAVSLAGVCDLRRAHQLKLGGGAVEQLLGGAPDAVPDRYALASPVELLPLGTQQVLVHGADDPLVPVQISRDYQKAAVAKGDAAELVELAIVDHFTLIEPRSTAWPSVKGALAKFL